MLDREEFCRRFKITMATIVSEAGGEVLGAELYADEIAPTYFDGQYQDEPDISPEEWARIDVSYWEE